MLFRSLPGLRRFPSRECGIGRVVKVEQSAHAQRGPLSTAQADALSVVVERRHSFKVYGTQTLNRLALLLGHGIRSARSHKSRRQRYVQRCSSFDNQWALVVVVGVVVVMVMVVRIIGGRGLVVLVVLVVVVMALGSLPFAESGRHCRCMGRMRG